MMAPWFIAGIHGRIWRVSPSRGAPLAASVTVSSASIPPRAGGCGEVRTSTRSVPESVMSVLRGADGNSALGPVPLEHPSAAARQVAATAARAAIARFVLWPLAGRRHPGKRDAGRFERVMCASPSFCRSSRRGHEVGVLRRFIA